MLARIVAAVSPLPGETLVEIGPGEGALTRLLLERVPHLVAIEIDRDLAARLRAEFPPGRLTVHCADALEFPFEQLPQEARIVGNLPYNISTPLLFRFARLADHVRDLHFMLQREVVERMVARPSTAEYGRLSVMLQVSFDMRKLFLVAPGAFRPPPRVESALVRMRPLAKREDFAEKAFEALVRRAFSARRKTLRNALSGVDLAALGIDPKLRPENLSPQDYLRITRRLAAR